MSKIGPISYDKAAATASILSFIISVPLGLTHPESNYFSAAFVVAILFIFLAFVLADRDHRREISELHIETDEALIGLFGETATWMHKLSHEMRERLIWLATYRATMNLSLLQNETKTTGQHVCNFMSALLTYYVGQPIAVSIKIMDNALDGTEEVVTLARDQKYASGREIGNRHPVKDNTAFRRIRSGNGIKFGESDLVAEYEAGRYQNTNPDWKRQYQSAVVVPIRSENLDDETRKHEKFRLLGFLCADAKEAKTLRQERMDDYAVMLMAAADATFVYFDFVKHIGNEIAEMNAVHQREVSQ